MIGRTKRINDYKQIDRALPAQRFVDPEYVFLPLRTGRCAEYELEVEEGDDVALAQRLGMRRGKFFEQPILSTVSGTVVDTVEMTDEQGEKRPFLKVRNDYQDTPAEGMRERTEEEISALSKDEFVEIVKDNAIVGLGGSGFPSYIKMTSGHDIHTVVVNGVECEPYLQSDYYLIKEQAEEMLRGLSYIMRAVGAERGVVAVKSTKGALVEAVEKELGRFEGMNMQLAKVADYYPQGWENATFEAAVGTKVPVGTLPMEYGILGFNASTCAHIYEAVKYNRPILKRFVTVNGDALKNPLLVRVRVGTSVRELIDLAGGFREDVEQGNVVLGGPMMGVAAPDVDVAVVPTTVSILVIEDEEHVEEPCVRCGSCIYSCPVDIQPVSIMNAVKRGDKKALQQLEADRCIECGLCAYVCTSKIHVTDYCREGKRQVR